MINEVHVAGRLTRDPEIKQFSTGNKVAKIGLALNEKYKDKNGNYVDVTSFVDCECWNGLVSTVDSFLKKGSMVYISGRLKQDTWTDNNGNERSKIKIVAEKLKLFPKIGEAERTKNKTNSKDEEEHIPVDQVPSEPDHENSGKTPEEIPF